MSDGNQQNDIRTLAFSRSSIMRGMKKRRLAFLDIKRINEQVQTYELLEKDLIIGRTSDNPIQLSYPNISRHHSKISFSNDSYQIEDLESTNGTFVNGISIAKCILHPNDVIEIGETHIFYYEREELIS
jgi:pSer/pThr/pTyr-binding forkhead associated (FHA) protein